MLDLFHGMSSDNSELDPDSHRAKCHSGRSFFGTVDPIVLTAKQ